jgi:hypothetical protein
MIDEELEPPLVPDDALGEIKEVAPGLTGQELIYVYWRSLAVPPKEAYRRAGYEDKNWLVLDRRPAIRKAMENIQELLEPEYRVSLKRVQAIILEGIEMARRKDQPKVMIEGAVALAGVAGIAAPQKLQIQQHTVTENRGTQAQPAPLQLAQLPREQLEALLGRQRVLPPPVKVAVEVVEAEWSEVSE